VIKHYYLNYELS